MSSAYIDTHIAVFLYDGLLENLSKSAKREIEARDLLISPIVLLELEYLYKRQRTRIRGRALYDTIHSQFGVSLCRIPFPRVIDQALDLDWTSDPFDRMIVAQAMAHGDAPLITRDKNMLDNFSQAVW